ncbi:TonB-dependent receptor domain-containing protein [Edaphobacter modestus]|uniref:TonB-dependent receptor domain-containing protein n=1 Tax=Edaphobacter modestus TaxID=388466 RepID=UPI00102B0E45|nr:TonB-dependent receptor [Edaphobacter modestus]
MRVPFYLYLPVLVYNYDENRASVPCRLVSSQKNVFLALQSSCLYIESTFTFLMDNKVARLKREFAGSRRRNGIPGGRILGVDDWRRRGENHILNQAVSYGQGSYSDEWGQCQWRDAIFFQDDWKVTPNLTINLGMRWEWDQPLYEVNNKQTNINLTTGAILFAGQDGNSRALYNSFYGGVMPRIGFAYTPQSFAGKFIVRGGYGITNFLEGTGANLRLPLNPPFFTDASGTHTEGEAYFQVQSGFPRPADATTFAGNVRAWDPNLKPALIQQYNLTTETELNRNTSLVIAYLGQSGNHLIDPREANQRLCPTCPLPVSSLPGLSQVTQVSLTESESMMNYTPFRLRAAVVSPMVSSS